ncbi:MAG: hypothetical protein KGI98_16455, partial [Euryarchaeota archaeon]|nr:hypothetical protein [Euryarchaeota archaeon]
MVHEWSPPPSPAPVRGGPAVKPTRREGPIERFLPGIWLFLIAALMFVLADITYGPGALFGNRIYPIWALCVGLGTIATSGGVLTISVPAEPVRLATPASSPGGTPSPSEVPVRRSVPLPAAEAWGPPKSSRPALLRAARGRKQEGGIPPWMASGLEHDRRLSELASIGSGSATFDLPGGRGSRGSLSSLAPPSHRGLGLTPDRTGGRLAGVPQAEKPNEAAALSPAPPPGAAEVPYEPSLRRTDRTAPGASLPTGPTVPPSPSARMTASARPTPLEIPPPPASRLPAPRLSPPATVPPLEPQSTYSEDEELPTTSLPPSPSESGVGLTGEMAAHLEEIEDLARKFAAVTLPVGALGGDPAPTVSSPPSEITTRPAVAPSPATAHPPSEVLVAPLPSAPTAEPKPSVPFSIEGPSAPRSPVDLEASALRAALDYGIDRKEGEPANAFLARAEDQIATWMQSLPPPLTEMNRARAFVDGLLQAQRELTEEELGRLDPLFRDRVNIMGKAVGITLKPGQSLVAYASALKAVFAAAELRRETLPRPAPTRTEPAPSSASGPSEQALAEELDRIADDLESL